MVESEFWLDTRGKTRLWVRKWTPENSARAVVNIVHGMSEHGIRYREFAEFLCKNGIEVWCADQRGHGKTADASINDKDEGGLLGHCGDKKVFFKLLYDINSVHNAIRKEHKSIPLFILGHSWGSFLTQAYIELFGKDISGVIMSGTRGPGGVDIKLGLPFLKFLTILFGVRRRSQFVYNMVFGSSNKPFAPCRTNADWISRDEKIVDAYVADPFCGNLPTIGFFHDLTYILNQIHRHRHIEKINRALPVYIFSGSQDPIGKMGKSVTALIKKYNSIGMKDLSYVLYPGARHECLNEINREEVMNNLLSWLEKHI
ncbi:MAG: lysophospholipase [Spirochaetaceae bacterium]|jgi:alpha-beta hydrolase superfamily lysophospholipase|nr:lysophospholipase [Spirochaetaceae bacterium]